ncbi:MAG: alkaline shock response membrane anchor protein AmaP [Planctomycetes bacterium]|nr:alkaline shock response membrane anchor protein AmaP [Planctomycetota bacterium]
MTVKSSILVVLGWFSIVGVGLLAVLAIVDHEYINGMGLFLIQYTQDPVWGWVIMFAGALLIGLGVILPFTGRSRSRSEKPIEFTSEVGSMIIEASALEDCLRRTALEDEDITDAAATIKVPDIGQDQPIVCSVRIGIRERPDIPGKGSEIAKKIRDRFLEILPMDTPPVVNLDRISIQRPKPVVTRTFTGVAAGATQPPPDDLPELGSHGDAPEREETEPEEEAARFKGITQYPVEEEEKAEGDGRGSAHTI